VSQGVESARSLEIRACLDDLGHVRDFINEHVPAGSLGGDGAGELLLAVDEAVSNVIMHGGGHADGRIEVRVAGSPDAISVRIRDEARLFDPTAARETDLGVSPLEREEAGGFGLALIRRLVDELHYRVTEDGGNELLLVKRRRQAAAPA
jgi:serine/threonine-protein kinase RsbW